jgi:transcriptional regulator with XRE-family HTH domain
MDVLDLLQQIEKQLLSKANNNKDRHSMEKIYRILEIIYKSISGFADDDKTVTETSSFDELMQSFDYQAKQNNKDAKKERIRISTRVPRDVA